MTLAAIVLFENSGFRQISCANMHSMKNWDDLQYVLAAHRHGGLSGAARALGVNHATVSRRLTAIEDAMRVRLFDRFSTGLKTTEYGEQAVEAALEMEQKVLGLTLSIEAKDRDLAGPLKISAPQLIIDKMLASVFVEFSRSYPQIDLSVIATSDSVNLHKREADVAIRGSNDPEGTLWGRKIVSQNCTYYGANSYLNGKSSNDILDCINFLWRGNEPAPEVVKAYPKAKVVAKFDDMVAVLGAVRAGMGVARMPCLLGDSEPNLQRLPLLDLQPYYDIWILTHPELKNVSRIQQFMRFAAHHITQSKDRFLGDLANKD